MSTEILPVEEGRWTDLLRLSTLAKFGVLWAAVLLFFILFWTTPGFATSVNLRNILDQQAVILMVAAPLTFTVIAGGFDISLSAVYVLAPLVGIQVGNSTGSIPLAVASAVAAGLICGAVNAALVVIFQINSFIATLATSYVIFGVAYLVSDQSILTPENASFRELATTRWLGITTATWLAFAIVAFAWFILAATRFGRYVYATGANPEAARLSGVRTAWIIAITFIAVAAAAGLAGIVNASASMSAQASDDFSFVFAVIAAVVVGGTSIAGGSGAVWRTVIGALFIALLGNGFNLNEVEPIYQRIILGVVIILAVGADAAARRRTVH